MLENSAWRARDDFPASQQWADDLERVLHFLVVQGRFETMLPRLRARERDATLAEARAAYHFHRNGFRISAWEPEAIPGIPGDFELAVPGVTRLFVEVKCPIWEGELTQNEISSGRADQPKYLSAEIHAIDPAERVAYVTAKALPKFAKDRFNVVAVVDNLFVSPLDTPHLLMNRLRRDFADPRYSTVSGVYLLHPVVYDSEVHYRAGLVVGPGKAMPSPVLKLLEESCTCSI